MERTPPHARRRADGEAEARAVGVHAVLVHQVENIEEPLVLFIGVGLAHDAIRIVVLNAVNNTEVSHKVVVMRRELR